MKKILLIIVIVSCYYPIFAQEKKLSLNELLSVVKRYHPIARQADIATKKAFYMQREALGGFDPKLEFTQEQKVFNGETYYNYFVPEVKVPLWYGVDVKGSYTSYEGKYVNPENKVPKDGLGSIGLNIPLGKGLLADERRAALQQAKLFQQLAVNEQQQQLNDLFVKATGLYVKWLQNWLNVRIYRQAVDLAEQRMRGTLQLYKQGDRPAIDTLEASILLQSRQQKLVEYETLAVNSKNEVATLLWDENLVPVDLSASLITPDESLLSASQPELFLNTPATTIAALNPVVKNYNLKLKQLEIEKRLKLEDLKPKLNVNINLLNSGPNIFNNLSYRWFENNQKFGLSFSMPLTFTKQRAAYSLAKLKIQEASYALLDYTNSLSNKLENYRNELKNLDQQSLSYSAMINQSKLLLNGEETKFKMGESSLFLVNAREQKLLELREKWNETAAKRIIVIQQIQWIGNSINVQ